jgi:putative ABC transport system substrate-binding protein
MRRRDFIAAFGSVFALIRSANVQSGGKRPLIGFMGTTTPSAWAPWRQAFVTRLREHGWIERETVDIEYRWAESRIGSFEEIISEFVRLNVDVIFTSGSGATVARRITSTTPIVFALAIDPLGGGLVSNLSRPGGNVTGLSQQAADLADKRIGLLRELLNDLRRLAIIGDPRISQSVVEVGEVETISRSLGLDVTKIELKRSEDILPAFQMLNGKVEAIYISTGPLINTHRVQLADLAISGGLPTMYSQRQYIDAGGLMSYGPSITDMFRRSADYVDKILRGTKPGEIPVEQPTKFELVINLKTAKALGLTVSSTLLARADEVTCGIWFLKLERLMMLRRNITLLFKSPFYRSGKVIWGNADVISAI